MNKKDVFLGKINEVKRLVRDELALSLNEHGDKSDAQLKMIIKELEEMEQALSIDVFAPYYPRGIADSWDFQDKLGNALMDLATLYAKL